MRVLIGIAQIPFVRRETETLAEDLSREIRRRGALAEIVRIPSASTTPAEMLDHIVAARLMDWTGGEASLSEILIALEFPAYLVPHPRKVLWLAGGPSLPPNHSAERSDGEPSFEEVAAACAQADRAALPGMTRRFTLSVGAAAHLRRRTSLEATPLYPPPVDGARYSWRRPDDSVLLPPGVPPGRVELVLQALAASASNLRVRHCGPLETPIEDALRESAVRLNVAHRIDWLGSLADRELAELYGRSTAILYPTLDDPFARVPLLAGLASKPIVVCADSGAPAELVEHGANGFVVEPDPSELAATLDELWRHPERSAAAGRAGRELATDEAFDWPHVLGELLGPDVPPDLAAELS